jgi:hypothetical protein
VLSRQPIFFSTTHPTKNKFEGASMHRAWRDRWQVAAEKVTVKNKSGTF